MPTQLHVLIVEDSEDDTELLLHALRSGGYEITHRRVDTAAAMEAALRAEQWDLVISDHAMPHFSAPAALAMLRQSGHDLPFIILSGSIGEEVAVTAMKSGAHDYIYKGNLGRLIPAVEREIREASERSARRHAEGALHERTEVLRALVQSSPLAIVGMDLEGMVRTWNPAAERLFGWTEQEVVGQPNSIGRDANHSLFQIPTSKLAPSSPNSFEVRQARKDGSMVDISISTAPLFDAAGEIDGMMAVIADVTERRRAEEALAHQALHDMLTDLPNRTLLHDRLHQAILAARRENSSLALMIMDLDRFKEINDTFGHHYGDFLLRQIGPRLRHALRESDTVARLGGDEFAILLPASGHLKDATATARKILKVLEEPFVVENQALEVDASVGITLYPLHGEDVETLMRRADVAMYTAKRNRDGYAVYAPDQDEHSAGRLTLTSELRHAIDEGGLVLYFQPKVDMHSGQLTGVEALVRWNHTRHGLLGPDQFIPLAEQTGLIKALSQWVLEAAVKQGGLWAAAGLTFGVAVNLSMRNLQDPQLPDIIGSLLSSCRLATPWLGVEITESTIMANPTRTMVVVTDLSRMGVPLSIDDFGTGYSSLAYLKRLPVREIKIDKSFIKDMGTDENDAVIVRSTIDLGHNLGLKVVAEGVETREAWERLARLGCDCAQGYYMGRPMPAADLERWLIDSPWGPATQRAKPRLRIV